ncbi:uncharacterized protein LOC129723344 [Wyeomyia smithii]|uniref:uncharacterized protein LOC129723344 n=1 Tax=Wyeomyia smithii TaxID=174621 RepID=UPI0024681EAB|nr:uncharacterized protein LOC129723344 [Wyeomyia smithii]
MFKAYHIGRKWLVERHNQGVLRALRIAKATKSDWRKAVKDYEFMYNTTPHTITGKPPLELLTGRPVKNLLPSLRTEPYWLRDEETRDHDAMIKMKGKIYADNRRNAKESEIDVGDTVMLKSYDTQKLEPNFKLEKCVVAKKSGNDVIVTNKEGVTYRRSVSHLKKWPSARCTEDSDFTETSFEQPASPEESTATDPSPKRDSNAQSSVSDRSTSQQRPKRAKVLPARYND